jgi:surface protein
MTITDNIRRISNAKDSIRKSIINKGVAVSDSALLDEYPALIDSIGLINAYKDIYDMRTDNGTNMTGLYARTSGELDLSNLDTSKATNMSYMFDNSSASVNIDGWDTSKVTSMYYMFSYFSGSIDISKLDTSSVTDMTYMFNYFSGSIDISKLDTSSVTNASYMFNNAKTDKIILTGLKFPKVTSFEYMFYQAKGTTLDLSSWDISNVTNMQSLIGFSEYKEVNFTNWKTTNVTNMNSIFYYLTNLEKLIIPDWDMTNTTNTSNFFYNCNKLNYIDLSRSNDTTIAKIATLVPKKTLATYGQMIIPVDSSQVNIEALTAKYWKPVGPRIDMTSTELTLELDEIKPGKTTKLYYNPEPWYANDVNVEYVSSDESVATVDKENMMVVSTGIEGTTEITARIIDTQEVISEPKVFSVSETDNYPNVIKVRFDNSVSGALINVNGKSITKSAFSYNTVSDIYTYDVGAPITSISMNSSSYFKEYVKLNTSNVTSMERMFYNCTNLTSLDLSNFDTSNVTIMPWMFRNCSNLTSLDLSNFDMTNVTNTQLMFYCCSKLHTIRLDNCSNDTIRKIITSDSFPTGAISGVTRTIYCKESEADGLTPPTNWVFSFID